MSSWQSMLTSPAFSALGGFLLRDIYEFLVRPVLNRVLNRAHVGPQDQDPEKPLQKFDALDEVSDKHRPITEDDLLMILMISKRKLRRRWKEGATIQPGYIIEKTREGYWTVQRAQVS